MALKKKIICLFAVIAIGLSLAGCGAKTEDYDSETLTSAAEFIISNFTAMTEEDFDSLESASDFQLDYTLLQTGLKISAQDFRSLMGSWKSAVKECGAYKSHGDYDIEVKSGSYVVSTQASFKEKQATLSFTFDKNMSMTALDVSPKLTMGEILKKAGLNTVLGMGTVFVVLIFLAFLISLLKYIPPLIERRHTKPMDLFDESDEVPPDADFEDDGFSHAKDDDETAAVIAAAVAAIAEDEGKSGGYVVRRIKRRETNTW